MSFSFIYEYDERELIYNTIDDEKTYNMLITIEDVALNHNGVIYGEYVRAKILHNYYTGKFYENENDLEEDKYWDSKYSIETIDRFMKIKEMCINFHNFDDYFNFRRKMETIIKDINFLTHFKTYTNEFPKIVLNITFDRIEPIKENIIFLCDCFIINSIKSKKNLTLSRNTGTPYDFIDEKTKEIVEKNIIKDIYKKTTVCIDEYCQNITLYEKILELMDIGWKISNLPYTIISSNENILEIPELAKFAKNKCSVCLKHLFNKKTNIDVSILYEDVYKPSSKFYPIHHKCLLNYFEFQNTNVIFTCPYRYKIDYTICRSLADFNYYKKIVKTIC